MEHATNTLETWGDGSKAPYRPAGWIAAQICLASAILASCGKTTRDAEAVLSGGGEAGSIGTEAGGGAVGEGSAGAPLGAGAPSGSAGTGEEAGFSLAYPPVHYTFEDAFGAWAVGEAGAVYFFDGEHWDPQQSGTSAHLFGVWATSQTSAWAVGEAGTMLRYDGGGWDPLPPESNVDWRRVRGTSPSDYWLVGEREIDGRLSAFGRRCLSIQCDEFQDYPFREQGRFSVRVRSLWTPARDVVWVSTDSDVAHHGLLRWDGSGWQELDDFCVAFGALGGVSEQAGWGIGVQKCFPTPDRLEVLRRDGTTWRSEPSKPMWYSGSPADGYAVGAIAEDNVWLAVPASSTWGSLLHWDGQALNPVSDEVQLLTRGFWVESATSVWSVGKYGLLGHLTDNWEKTHGGRYQLTKVWAAGPDAAWAVGYQDPSRTGGAVLAWDGQRWVEEAATSGFHGLGVWGSSARDVWVVGRAGSLLHYDGSSWSSERLSTDQDLQSVWGIGQDDVWTTDSVNIWRYDGSSWNQSPAPGEIRDGWSASRRDVWAVGGSNVFGSKALHHFDGQAWTSFDEPAIWERLTAVWGVASNDVWAASASGSIFHYDGQRWKLTLTVEDATWQDVAGSANSDVWFAGHDADDEGILFHYDGSSFSQIETNLDVRRRLSGVFALSPEQVWAVGEGSVIIQRAP